MKKLGKTGEFPQGRLNEADEGGLRMAVGIHSGKIIINFGTPVAWIGLDKKTAEGFAMMLLKRAKELGD